MQSARKWTTVVLGTAVVLSFFICIMASAQAETAVPDMERIDVDSILTYLDSIAMWMGNGIVSFVNESVSPPIPISLGRSLGYLIVLTILFVLAAASRRTRIVLLFALLGTWGLLIARFVTEIVGK